MRIVGLVTLSVLLLAMSYGQSGVVPAFSPVPPWPRDGILDQELKDHSVFFDPEANEVVVVPDPKAEAAASRAIRFDLHNQAEVAITSSVSKLEDGLYAYDYSVAVSGRSRRPLKALNFLVPAETGRRVTVSTGWGARPARTDLVDKWVPGNVGLEYVHISANEGRTLGPDGVLTFRITSEVLPGYVTCFAASAVSKEPAAEDIASLPTQVLEQLKRVLSPQWDSRELVVLGPRYWKDTPGLALVSSLHYSMMRLVNAGELDSNSELVQSAISRLRPYLESGVDRAFDQADFDFLDKGKTPKEREVASVLRLTLPAADK